MLNTDAVLATYQKNYNMAVAEGHTDQASKVAWDWTEEEIQRSFIRIKAQHEAAHQEAVNKVFYG